MSEVVEALPRKGGGMQKESEEKGSSPVSEGGGGFQANAGSGRCSRGRRGARPFLPSFKIRGRTWSAMPVYNAMSTAQDGMEAGHIGRPHGG